MQGGKFIAKHFFFRDLQFATDHGGVCDTAGWIWEFVGWA